MCGFIFVRSSSIEKLIREFSVKRAGLEMVPDYNSARYQNIVIVNIRGDNYPATLPLVTMSDSLVIMALP